MYVLVSDGRVLNGPRNWSYRSFTNTLQEELGITYSLPFNKTDSVAIHISDTVKIYPAVIDDSTEYNPKIEYLHGPFWDFTNNVATGTFTVESNSLESIKGYLKSVVAANRYNKEISGITQTVNNVTVTVDTDRETRNIFFQKYLLMAENETVEWKFPEAWLTLTKTQLGSIVSNAASHIETQFAWEANKVVEIESANTAAELDVIVLE